MSSLKRLRGEPVEYPRVHGREMDELGRIDYFLDHLARAVERGEVPLASYEALAPRYLERRADLVAILSRPSVSAPAAHGAAPSAVPVAIPGATPAAAGGVTAAPPGGVPMTARPVRAVAPTKAPPKPVDWTSVLLFLGAFLVIAASAIFAITVWDIAGPLAKLLFMGTLTVGFYVAGYFARTRLHLRAGSTALTVVGSAMLLFDSWIVISGYALKGPFPWAVALLLISVAYWFTEVRLGDRFYGLAGAAAQVGWWWLMGSGLHLEVPVRLAGIAAVALVWQLLAERARDDSSVGSLARVLLWAAPIVELIAGLGIAWDALSIGAPTWALTGSALVAAGSGGIVVWRSALIGRGREWIAGIAQVPFFIVLFLPSDASWLGVALLVTMTAVYALFALFRGGVPFTLAAVVTESLAVAGVGSLLKAGDREMVVVFGVLAVTWVVASRLAASETLAGRRPPLQGLAGFATTTWIAGLVLLAISSLASLAAGSGVPLSGARIDAKDAAMQAALLACWAAASLARRGRLFASLTTAWSFVALAALAAWLRPEAHSTTYALAILLLAAVWLAARGAMERFYGIDQVIFGWTLRGWSLFVIALGFLAETIFHGTISGWHGATLAAGGAVLFAADSAFAGPDASASLAAVLAVFSAYLAGAERGFRAERGIVAASGAAVALSVVGAVLRQLRVRHAAWVAVAAAAAGTLACATGSAGERALAIGLALSTVAWLAAGFAAREPRLSVAVGLSAFATVAAAIAAANPSFWVTIAVLGVTGVALGAVALVWPVAGPDGSHRGLGQGFSVAGLVGLMWLAALGWSATAWWRPLGSWSAITQQGVVVCLLILGAYVVVQATRWRIEPGLYAGYAVFLLAAFVQFDLADASTAEWYSTAVAVYLIAMGYLYASRDLTRTVPIGIDIAAVVVALGVPVQLSLGAAWRPDAFTHTAWAVLLSLLFVAAGIVLKVRAYLFGGAAALVVVTGYRTITYLAAFWWLVLGLIGMVMLVIALTWERQRVLLSETQRRLRDSFERWR